ncbi:MAG: hypothetical protein IJC26_04885 [Clostridia bacterium]|nr:hypothetical protein [Clostridia bacterium]
MSNWSNKWKNILIWLSGYISFIAFAIVGGYAIVKEEDELKHTAKKVLIITLIFTAISAFLSIFNAFGTMSDSYFSSNAYDFYVNTSNIVNVAKIVTYAVFIIIELCKKGNKSKEEKNQEN